MRHPRARSDRQPPEQDCKQACVLLPQRRQRAAIACLCHYRQFFVWHCVNLPLVLELGERSSGNSIAKRYWATVKRRPLAILVAKQHQDREPHRARVRLFFYAFAHFWPKLSVQSTVFRRKPRCYPVGVTFCYPLTQKCRKGAPKQDILTPVRRNQVLSGYETAKPAQRGLVFYKPPVLSAADLQTVSFRHLINSPASRLINLFQF